MASQAPSFCLACGRLVARGDYCPAHRPRHHLLRRTAAYRRAARAAKAFLHQRCPACGQSMTLANPPTLDHRVPLSKGGTNEASNLRVLCRHCNLGRCG